MVHNIILFDALGYSHSFNLIDRLFKKSLVLKYMNDQFRLSRSIVCIFFFCHVILHTSNAQNVEKATKIKLTNDELSVIVDLVGGRITSFSNGYYEVLTDTLIDSENYGSTLWIAPQSIWGWPPITTFGKDVYHIASHTTHQLVINSNNDKHYHYQVNKSFQLNFDHLEITYVVINTADENQSVAAWEVSRVNKGGWFFCQANSFNKKAFDVVPFTQIGDIITYDDRQKSGKRLQSLIDGKGWLAYYEKSWIFLKEFDDVAAKYFAPGESDIIVYYDDRSAYIELENQSQYTTLSPGDSLSYRVKWRIIQAGSGKSTNELVDLIKIL